MDLSIKKLLTIICEAELETILIKRCLEFGVRGYTICDARGYGNTGARDSQFSNDRNISFQTICSTEMAEKIAKAINDELFANYAIIIYLSDVQVVRANKF